MDKSGSLSPWSRQQIEDNDDELFVPDLTQVEAFALFDDFYSTLPGTPVPVPEFGDDDFADMMESLDEIEKSTHVPDGDLVMHDVSSPLPGDSSAISPAITAPLELPGDEHLHTSPLQDLPMPDAPAELHSTNKTPFDGVPADASPGLPTAPEIFEEQHLQTHGLPVPADTPAGLPNTNELSEEQHMPTPSLPDLPTLDASPVAFPPSFFDGDSSAASPALASSPTMAPEQRMQTPTLALTSKLISNERASSIAPSTGGHRSSMQGEMRQEEEELEGGDLGELPPFPDIQASGEHPKTNAINPTSVDGRRQGVRDLSGSRDIGEQQAAEFVKPLPKQVAASLPPLPKIDPKDSAKSLFGPSSRRDSVHAQQQPSQSIAPAVKKPRHLPWAPAPDSTQIPPQKPVKAPKPTRMSESDSSLTDVSMSAIMATSPEKLGEQLPARTDKPSTGDKPERKDSLATSLRDTKSVAPSSQVQEDVAEKKTTKPKATTKRKRKETTASSASPGPTNPTKIQKTNGKSKETVVSASSASPAPTKPLRNTKAVGKSKESAAMTQDLKSIMGDKILSDVLGKKDTGKTRGQQKARQKAIDEARPDPALAAKSRNTGKVNYKE